jgi:small conductance mechanosensitive channel
MNTEAIWTFLTTQGADFGLKVIGALIAWGIGRWLIGLAQRLVAKALEGGKRMDPTLSHYLVSILGVPLNIVLILSILDMFGVRTTSFAALLAGAGLAIGAAWGGMLTHFAAGVVLQVLRPYKVGDYVTVGGVNGIVSWACSARR